MTLAPAPDDVDTNENAEYDSELREDWLQTDISDLDEGRYHIESSVEISVTSNNGQDLGSASVEHLSEDHEVE